MTVIDIRTARRTERGVADIVIDEHRKGFAALLLTGRSLVDFDVDADGHIRACVEILRKRLFVDAAIHLTTYSLASGFEWGGLSCKNQESSSVCFASIGCSTSTPTRTKRCESCAACSRSFDNLPASNGKMNATRTLGSCSSSASI